MFLKRLYLEDVRAIGALDLPFTDAGGAVRQWTLLLGQNGCGKSTVLRSIALLMAGSEALPELLVNPDSWVRLGAESARIAADLVTAQGEERHIELRIRRGSNVRDLFKENEEPLDRLDRALRHSTRNYLIIGYGVSRRLGDPNRLTSSSGVFTNPRAQSVATMFSNDAVLNPLETWAIGLDYEHGEAGVGVVRQTLNDLLPGVAFDRIDKKSRRLLFRTPDGELPLDQLSDGYQNAAAWCGDLLYRITTIFGDYRDPLAARGLLLIDEMDLHLHPTWKRRLVEFLTEKLPNFQIVATTHSALTVHQAGEGELFVLKRDGASGSSTLHPFPGNPSILMLHQLLASPIFELETVDSVPVENLRAEYESLSSRPRASLSREEKRRLPEVKSRVASLPDWSGDTPEAQAQRSLIAEIHEAVKAKAGPGGPKPAGRRTRKPSGD